MSVRIHLTTRILHELISCGGGAARLRWRLLELQADSTGVASRIRPRHCNTLGLWQVVCHSYRNGLRIRNRSIRVGRWSRQGRFCMLLCAGTGWWGAATGGAPTSRSGGAPRRSRHQLATQPRTDSMASSELVGRWRGTAGRSARSSRVHAIPAMGRRMRFNRRLLAACLLRRCWCNRHTRAVAGQEAR